VKAIALDAARNFVALDFPEPQPEPRDLLVRIAAVSVNPIDGKVRAAHRPDAEPRVLGWDAAGVVEAVGTEVKLFRPGDAVMYAGSLDRPGSNSELQLVDERLVGRKPQSLDFVQAAALPLTTLTAWEALFEHLAIPPVRTTTNQRSGLLVIGAAGGVGSIAIQLAKHLTGIRVFATASRPESRDWCLKLGADDCLDHREDLARQISERGVDGVDGVDYILNCNSTDAYLPVMAQLIRPFGTICCLVSSEKPLDLNLLKNKSAAFAWEFMFTRPLFRTPDMAAHHHILERVADLVDQGQVHSTLTESPGPLTTENLRAAHERLGSGRMIGKLALSGILA
jgi:zinc-binding alcohol dehydrogenase family protein